MIMDIIAVVLIMLFILFINDVQGSLDITFLMKKC
jgi:hypothetical protein